MDMNDLSAAERRSLMHQQAHGQPPQQHIPQVVNANTASQSSQIRTCPALQVAAAPQPATGILLADHMQHQVIVVS